MQTRDEGTIKFRPREFKGSRLRCLTMTSLPDEDVAVFLNELVRPHATVTAGDVWQPRGFVKGDEARLGESSAFLDADQRSALTAWWLRVPHRANTPNWDLVSTCRVEGRRGLLLVEAKAHVSELHRGGKSAGNPENDLSIAVAISEANAALGSCDGWNLSHDAKYQLCNRFAWAWKVASLGVPVVLTYLGFLNATEMGGGRFASASDWTECLQRHAKGTVPNNAWEQRHVVGNGWFVPMIRSATVSTIVVVNRGTP